MQPAGWICALALAGGAAAGVGCGSSGAISGTDASRLQDGLDQVSQAVGSGKCGAAASAVDSLDSQVSNLRGKIPAKLRANLADGVAKLKTAAARDCQDAQQQTQPETTTQTTTETTTPTDTVTDTTPTDTTTTPTDTTPTDTTSTPTDTTTDPTGGVPPETTTTTPPADTSGGASGGATG